MLSLIEQVLKERSATDDEKREFQETEKLSKMARMAAAQINEQAIAEVKAAIIRAKSLEEELQRTKELLNAETELRTSSERMHMEKHNEMSSKIVACKSDIATAKAELAVEKKAKAALESKNLASEKKAEAAELNMLKKIESLIESTRKIEAKEPKEPDMTSLEQKIDRLLSQESRDDSMKVAIPALDVVRGADGKVLRLVPRTLN